MGEIFAEKKKTPEVEIHLGSKTYTVKCEKVPEVKEIKVPHTKNVEKVNAFFAKLATEYNVAIYKEDGTKVESPSDKMLAKAGKALLQKSIAQQALENTIETQKKIFAVPKKV